MKTGKEKRFSYLPRHTDVGEITITKFAVIIVLMFLTGTIITSAIHELGIVISTAILGGSVIHTTISWFWGATQISGNLPAAQMFFVMISGTLFVFLFMFALALFPEPLYTNLTAVILGFRNFIDGAPFLAGSDGFQAAKISLIGAWAWYIFLIVSFGFIMAYALGYRIDFREGLKWN
jgi:hypothetical protein